MTLPPTICTHPLEALRSATGQPRFVWWTPERLLVGHGVATEVTATGPDRLARVRAALPTAPLWFGGFAFRADHHPSAPWEGFPAARFVAPADIQALDPHLPFPADIPLPPLRHRDPLPDRDAWRRMVDAALTAIARGDLTKVVLARALRLTFAAPLDPLTVLARLRRAHPDTFCFLVEPRPGCAFLGATPELLARVQGDHLETEALAGSIARGVTPAEDRALGERLLQSDKDRREHALVVDAIRRALTPLTETLHIPPAPRLRRLANVQHLETPIHARLRSADLLRVVEALHPTPALGGTPRPAALDFIARHEPFPRGWYAAPVGWLNADGEGEFAVAIRSALICGRTAILYAGAGIVAGSEPDREWEETTLKLDAMRRALTTKPMKPLNQ